jgi:hypothetical protein
VCHETMPTVSVPLLWGTESRNVLCNTFQHRPRLEDEGGQRYSAQVGARSQLRDDVREHCGVSMSATSWNNLYPSPPMLARRTAALLRVHDRLVFFGDLVALVMSPCFVYRGCAAA